MEAVIEAPEALSVTGSTISSPDEPSGEAMEITQSSSKSDSRNSDNNSSTHSPAVESTVKTVEDSERRVPLTKDIIATEMVELYSEAGDAEYNLTDERMKYVFDGTETELRALIGEVLLSDPELKAVAEKNQQLLKEGKAQIKKEEGEWAVVSSQSRVKR